MNVVRSLTCLSLGSRMVGAEGRGYQELRDEGRCTGTGTGSSEVYRSVTANVQNITVV